MARRRRILSDDDRELWGRVTQDATPMHDLVTDPVVQPDILPSKNDIPAPFRILKSLRPTGPTQPTGGFRLDLAGAPGKESLKMDKRAFERMSRGKLAPSARIDLHGMTVAHAHGVLRGFILRAHSNGARLVLVITGKGKPDANAIIPERYGVLRHQVPHWLRLPPLAPLVLQIAPAHRRHGGEGAYYVYLRRSK